MFTLQARDFKKDPEGPEKSELYQAEALIHRYLPVDALLGVVTYNDAVKDKIQALVSDRELELGIHSRPTWFF
ncbi:DarT ssDNA thymidine ADP-ribosyltransferase family protein [Marinobacter gelidimuriae]|uniref:DarT ssDNA thymidine ADP-ribosyltransferase family protein n=1 Tax=Marinobacter gelidimuriae TaxID=2739064 RepID=UPI0003780702